MKKLFFYLLCVFTFLTLITKAQNNSVFKVAISANADSTTVRNTVAASQSYYSNIGALYYNRQSSKWRIFSDSAWYDLLGGLNSIYAYNGLTSVGSDSVRWGGTLNQNTTIAQAGFNTTFSGIGKVTFSPTTGGGSIAGLNVGSIAGNPSTLANGDMWYNSSTADLMTHKNSLTGVIHTDNDTAWDFGTTDIGGSTRTLSAIGSSSDIDLIFVNKGAGRTFNFNTTSGSAILDAGGSATAMVIRGGSTSSVTIGGSSTDAGLQIDGTSSSNVNVSGGQGVDVTLLIGTGGANTNDLIIETNTNAGQTLKINDGINEQMGSATLVGGTVTVNNVKVTATSRIFLTTQNPGGTPGAVYISARVAGTSFTITSTSGTDTSDVAWLIIEPN